MSDTPVADAVGFALDVLRETHPDGIPPAALGALDVRTDRLIADTIRARLSGPAPLSATLAAETDRDRRIADHITAAVDDLQPVSAVSCQSIATATGIPHSSVGRSRVWEAFQTWRAEVRGAAGVRLRSITEKMLAVVADQRTDDPAEIVSGTDAITAMIDADTDATPEERAEMHLAVKNYQNPVG